MADDNSNRPNLTVTGSMLAAPVASPAGIVPSKRFSPTESWLSHSAIAWPAIKAGMDTTRSLARMNPWYAALEAQWEREMKRQFVQWIKDKGFDAPDAEGRSVAGRVYTYSKTNLQGQLQDTPEPLRSFMKSQFMNNAELQAVMRNEDMADLFKWIGDTILEAFPGDHGLLFEQQYNNQFLTEDSKGNIVPITEDEIVALFPKGKTGHEKRFPHIIVTYSHAQGETLKDVTSITHGSEAMARDSHGKQLPIGHIDKGIKPGEALIIYACDVRESPWYNAEALLRRIGELQRIEKTDEIETEFKYMSPGARRVAKLMLKCMAEEPNAIKTDELNAMSEVVRERAKPLILREDEAEVANHFQPEGFSKGGNTASDTGRYEVAQLTATRAGSNEQVFAMHEHSLVRDPSDRSMSERNVHNILRNTEIMANASVEVAMSDHYKRHGVRRVAINNNHDPISAHHNYDGSKYDERWLIEGVEDNVGHDPRHMLGMRTVLPGYVTERGYGHDDPRVARRWKERYARNHGKAAIGHLDFTNAHDGKIIIEAASGTTDAQMNAKKETIIRAFTRAGLRGVELTDNRADPGVFTLECDADFANGIEPLQKLRRAFAELRHQAKGLLITQNIDEEIYTQMLKVSEELSASGHQHGAQINLAPVTNVASR